ncbi:MAG: septal ring lytic transglycosylase RlpA family protein [Burkholderiales bacterium]|nr:septal ring lytic transglycosylase RlpA family protein [Burkholderiales bacterium]
MPAPIARLADPLWDQPVDVSAGEPAVGASTEPTTGRGLKPQGTQPAHWPDDLTLSSDRPDPMGLRATPDALPGPSSGLASWYADHFHGRRTASGEPYSRYEMTAAHRDLPLGTLLYVSNPETGVGVVVRVNDRGPFHGDRVIDVSRAAANVLGLVGAGVGQVDLRLPSSEEAAEFARRLAQAAMRPAVTSPRASRAAPAARPAARPLMRPTARSPAPLARKPLR